MALEGLSRGIFRSIGLLKNKRKLDDEELREMTRSLRRALQEADFNVRQTKEIVERMESRLREETPRPGITMQTHAMNILYTELVRLLGPAHEFQPHGATLLLVGLYGQGKTTTTANGIAENMVFVWLLSRLTCIVLVPMPNSLNSWKTQLCKSMANLKQRMRQPLSETA
jgi:signal recognition particle GTPase